MNMGEFNVDSFQVNTSNSYTINGIMQPVKGPKFHIGDHVCFYKVYTSILVTGTIEKIHKGVSEDFFYDVQTETEGMYYRIAESRLTATNGMKYPYLSAFHPGDDVYMIDPFASDVVLYGKVLDVREVKNRVQSVRTLISRGELFVYDIETECDGVYKNVPENRVKYPGMIRYDKVAKAINRYIRRDAEMTAELVCQCSKKKKKRNPNYRTHVRPYHYDEIEKVIFNNPCTIVILKDGRKTIVRCKDGDVFDPEKGLAMALCKLGFGSNKNLSNYYEIFEKWCPKEEPVVDTSIEDYALCAFNFGKDEKKNNVAMVLKEMPEDLRTQILDVLLHNCWAKEAKEPLNSDPCKSCTDISLGCFNNCDKLQTWADGIKEEPKPEPIKPGYFLEREKERKEKPVAKKSPEASEPKKEEDDTGMMMGISSFVKTFQASYFPANFLRFCRKHDLYFYIVDEVKGGMKKVDPYKVTWQQMTGYLKRGLMESCNKTNANHPGKTYLAVNMDKALFSRLPLELRKANRKEEK